MKLTVEFVGDARYLADRCNKGLQDTDDPEVTAWCPIGCPSLVICPFKAKPCREITPEDWAKLEVKDE